MFEPDRKIIEEYAKLAIINGVNVQKGQPLVINAPIEAYEVVRECIKIAYAQGASIVNVNYSDNIKTRLDYENVETDVLSRYPEWQVLKKKDEVDNKACYLHIISDDPDLLNGIDSDKVKKCTLSRMKALKDYQYYTMNSIGQWCIMVYPNLAWAKKVFPNMNDDEAMQALWQAILYTSRIEIGKTIDNWDAHNKEIIKHARKLNEYNFKSLHFINNLGTDLTIGLIKNHIWEGGYDVAKGDFKVKFNANIPTEEVFTMPDRYHIDGKVVSTKPLSYNGTIIPQFELTFKDGQVVEYDAKENIDVLKNLLETDKGTKSLGEVALISYDSPISNLNVLFYETLFDENASCHLALGACYPTNVKGGIDLSEDELYELGGNSSMEHCDFMFGSKDMEIIGTTYKGEQIAIFKDGNFII